MREYERRRSNSSEKKGRGRIREERKKIRVDRIYLMRELTGELGANEARSEGRIENLEHSIGRSTKISDQGYLILESRVMTLERRLLTGEKKSPRKSSNVG